MLSSKSGRVSRVLLRNLEFVEMMLYILSLDLIINSFDRDEP